MDGIMQSDATVFVLAASNFPFDLDPALLRRLEKRILVPFPDVESREAMFRQFLTPDLAMTDFDFPSLAQRTEGYSGSDIRLVCKESAMQPLRRLMDQLKAEFSDDYLDQVQPEDVSLERITQANVTLALEWTSASDASDTGKYEQWQEKLGVV
jgi:katanin p60 ATPase-containing subunit A1